VRLLRAVDSGWLAAKLEPVKQTHTQIAIEVSCVSLAVQTAAVEAVSGRGCDVYQYFHILAPVLKVTFRCAHARYLSHEFRNAERCHDPVHRHYCWPRAAQCCAPNTANALTLFALRTAVQRASFDGSMFTDERWHAMAAGLP
jgi:hypothetical protein